MAKPCARPPPLHVLQLARHHDAALLAATPVGTKTNEYAASPVLLAGLDLRGRVVTGDAMFCGTALTELITRRGGHWLFAVKANQPTLYQNLVDHFAAPRSGPEPLDLRQATTTHHAHGRYERRRLEATEVVDHLAWPHARQALRRTTQRTVQGRDTLTHHDWLTSLPPELAGPRTLETLCRGHWTIENQVNRVRDVTFGEDQATLRTGSAPLTALLLRSLAAWLLRTRSGFTFLPDARRHYALYPFAALQLIGAAPTTLT